MDNKTPRLRRAIKNTIILALILAAPMGIMIYLRVTRGNSLRDLGEVQPFIVKDRSGTYFDHTRLSNHVTVVALFPMGNAATRASAWLSKQLAADPSKPKAPIQQLAILPQGMETSAEWRSFDAKVFGANQIVPGDPALTAPGFYIIDPKRHFRANFPLDANGEIDWKMFEAALSRMTMNLYFNDYLAKRTFFGPVKEKGKP